MGSRHVPARTVLFEREKNGVTYRVPALLYIPRWLTLLAFAEERLSPDDAHANLLVLRRGILYHSYVEWEDMFAVEKAHLPGHRSMNPCPIYDDFTGQIFLFFIAVQGRTTESYQIITGQNLAKLCYVTSSDQGRTWSDVTDLTQKVIGESLKEWATFALGPGHGIQLKSGRLLLPAYTYHIDCRNCFGKLCRTTPRAFAFHSDDHGKTWTFGDLVPNLQTVECQLVSVDEEDGSNVLYCNARSSLGFRVQALSYDGGVVFQEGQLVEKLVETPNGCHGSVIGFPAPLKKNSRLNTQNILLQKPMNAISVAKTSNIVTKRVYRLLQKGESSKEKYEVNRQNNICKVMVHKQTKGKAIVTGSDNRKQASSDPTDIQVQKRFLKTDYQFQLPTWVLYSHPTCAQRRMNLGIYLSPYPKDADSWTNPWIIYEGPSAYSDLTYIELQSGELGAMASAPLVVFGCLYENGITSPYEQISFSMFTLYEVIQNLPFNPALPLPSMMV
ncbi:sialidase-4-like [Hyla sarda]|uniref:sialidase-4-like n=1 Tax=Hyla sarda TaxID=327740 RepID=UPI0024C26D94|nr:sialidase-4-like [Hyla sarda]XP_056420412.1 sialidase-4-like [Hyla sarda]XP_056420413.1 sialidase-4-like [Hyla sarda]